MRLTAATLLVGEEEDALKAAQNDNEELHLCNDLLVANPSEK